MVAGEMRYREKTEAILLLQVILFSLFDKATSASHIFLTAALLASGWTMERVRVGKKMFGPGAKAVPMHKARQKTSAVHCNLCSK